MKKVICCLSFLVLTLCFPERGSTQPSEIPNRLIDSSGFMADTIEAQKLRLNRRVSEAEFVAMQKDPTTIVLDARSLAKYEEMHIKGAKHLNFADFTESSLAKLIPQKSARILIYCNNNIENAERAFPTKRISAALNLSTYTSLYSYGYRNVFELGPVIDPADSKIQFAVGL